MRRSCKDSSLALHPDLHLRFRLNLEKLTYTEIFQKEVEMDFSIIVQSFLSNIENWAPIALRIVLIIVFSWAFWWFFSKMVTRITKQAAAMNTQRGQRIQTLSSLMHSVLNFGVLAIMLTLILGALGINLGPIIAAAGVVGLAIGFGAQSLVKDVLNGLFFLLENHVRVGDVIEAAGKVGQAEQITLRTLILRDFAGKVHVIPHGEITTVTNLSKDYSRALISIGVAYREDADHVMRLLQEEGEALAADPRFSDVITDGPEVFGIDDFNDSDLLFKVRFKTVPLEQWNVARAFRLRIKRRFDLEGVEIPFPHQTLYFGEDKDGTAPPAHVLINHREHRQITAKSEDTDSLMSPPLPDGNDFGSD